MDDPNACRFAGVSGTRLEELERLLPCAFSAATFHLPDGRTIAVCNPCNDPGRTNSDIGHEFAHILLDRDVGEIQQLAARNAFASAPTQRRRPGTPDNTRMRGSREAAHHGQPSAPHPYGGKHNHEPATSAALLAGAGNRPGKGERSPYPSLSIRASER